MMFPPFPGEPYLINHPPNYEERWADIKRHALLLAFVFVFVLPSFVKSLYNNRPEPQKNQENENSDESTISLEESLLTKGAKVRITTSTAVNGQSRSRQRSVVERKGKRGMTEMRKKNSISKGRDTSVSDSAKVGTEAIETNASSTTTPKDLPSYILPLINIFFLASLAMLIFYSPNNLDTARQVYLAPLLRPEECQAIIDIAERAAARNAQRAENDIAMLAISNDENAQSRTKSLQKVLEWPSGYKKDRHSSYPTTDLNVAIDFNDDDKAYLKKILDSRLSPLLERVYGVTRDSVRANDMFVVRYDGEGQQSLRRHTDSSHISFNVLLNEGFEGGGTRFHNTAENTSEDAKPTPGQVLLNNAMVFHEGLPTTKGTRYIFVGFTNVDQKNPFRPSQIWDVSWFSTYLSFPWLTVTLKEGLAQRNDATDSRVTNPMLSKNYYINGLLTQLTMKFGMIGEIFAPHGIVSLVNEENTVSYLNAMDEFQEAYGDRLKKSSWFAGQQVHLKLDGTVHSEWKERKYNPEKFWDPEL